MEQVSHFFYDKMKYEALRKIMDTLSLFHQHLRKYFHHLHDIQMILINVININLIIQYYHYTYGLRQPGNSLSPTICFPPTPMAAVLQ